MPDDYYNSAPDGFWAAGLIGLDFSARLHPPPLLLSRSSFLHRRLVTVLYNYRKK